MTIIHAADREEVMAFLDGELAVERAAAVEAHIKTCSDCRAFVDGLRDVSGRMTKWSVDGPPLAQPPQRRAAWLRASTRWGVPRWIFVAAPTAAVLVVVLVRPPGGSERVAPTGTPSAMHNQDRLHAMGRGGVAGNSSDVPKESYQETAPARAFPPSGVRPTQGQQGQQRRPEQPTGPMIARAVSLTIVTDHFGDVRVTLERISADARGTISSLTMTGDPPARRSLNATLRVPADRLETALIEVRKIGSVRQESQSSEDVSAAHRDLVVRIDNAIKEEARLNELLQNRTGRLQDVLAVEQEMTRVRGQIEQMKAEELATRNRVTYATINLDITEAYRAEATLGPQPIRARLRNALVEGWKSAANTAIDLVLLILEAGPSIMFWLVLLGVPSWWYWRRVRRTV